MVNASLPRFGTYDDVLAPYLRLSQRQVQVMRAISQMTKAARGRPPSGQDIADALEITAQGVWDKCRALKQKGLIRSEYGVHRSLELTPEGTAALALAEASAQRDLPVMYLPWPPPANQDTEADAQAEG